MATEAPRTTLDRRELFRRLIGRPIDLSTLCKTFDRTPGQVKEVFDDFLLFVTRREAAGQAEITRHWILFSAISVMTESPKPTPEDVEIQR